MTKANDDEQHGLYENIANSKLSDWVKKTLLTSAGAVFMTEEGIRKSLSELKMPKNVIASAVAQADRTKKEISGLVAKEVRRFLDGIEVDELIKKALAGQVIEINATIKFSDGSGPKKKATTRAASTSKKKA